MLKISLTLFLPAMGGISPYMSAGRKRVKEPDCSHILGPGPTGSLELVWYTEMLVSQPIVILRNSDGANIAYLGYFHWHDSHKTFRYFITINQTYYLVKALKFSCWEWYRKIHVRVIGVSFCVVSRVDSVVCMTTVVKLNGAESTDRTLKSLITKYLLMRRLVGLLQCQGN